MLSGDQEPSFNSKLGSQPAGAPLARNRMAPLQAKSAEGLHAIRSVAPHSLQIKRKNALRANRTSAAPMDTQAACRAHISPTQAGAASCSPPHAVLHRKQGQLHTASMGCAASPYAPDNVASDMPSTQPSLAAPWDPH